LFRGFCQAKVQILSVGPELGLSRKLKRVCLFV
jgi:hypothetical protein